MLAYDLAIHRNDDDTLLMAVSSVMRVLSLRISGGLTRRMQTHKRDWPVGEFGRVAD